MTLDWHNSWGVARDGPWTRWQCSHPGLVGTYITLKLLEKGGEGLLNWNQASFCGASILEVFIVQQISGLAGGCDQQWDDGFQASAWELLEWLVGQSSKVIEEGSVESRQSLEFPYYSGLHLNIADSDSWMIHSIGNIRVFWVVIIGYVLSCLSPNAGLLSWHVSLMLMFSL